jgi:hypothetical protein
LGDGMLDVPRKYGHFHRIYLLVNVYIMMENQLIAILKSTNSFKSY